MDSGSEWSEEDLDDIDGAPEESQAYNDSHLVGQPSEEQDSMADLTSFAQFVLHSLLRWQGATSTQVGAPLEHPVQRSLSLCLQAHLDTQKCFLDVHAGPGRDRGRIP